MVFTKRLFLVTLGFLLLNSLAFATNYKMKFNPQTGRGDWVVDDSSLGGGGGAATSLPYSSITNPTANSRINFAGFTNTWTSTVGNATFFTLDGSGTDFVIQGDGDVIANSFTGPLVGNASTATALAANGANCSAGNYPLGVDASGAVEECTAASSGGISEAPYNLLKTPTTNTGINFASFTNTWTSAGAGDFFKIDGGGTDFTVQGDGDTTVADLTIGGDDLFMATNTSGAVLVADGTNFNPVVMSGDVAIGTTGTTAIQANSVALTTDTTGNYAAGDGEAGAALTGDSAASFFAAGELEVARGGTGVATLTDGGILIGNGTSGLVALGVATNGQIPVGDGTTDPVLATLTQSTGIAITNGAGTITVAYDGTYDEIGDAGASGSVAFGNFTNTWTSTTGTGDFFVIGNATTGTLFKVNRDATVQVGESGDAGRYWAPISGYTADPCSAAGTAVVPNRGSFWNDTADEPCVCTAAGVDLRTKDMTTACY